MAGMISRHPPSPTTLPGSDRIHVVKERPAASSKETIPSNSTHQVSSIAVKQRRNQVFTTNPSDPALEGRNEDLCTLIQQKYNGRVAFSGASPTEFTQPLMAWNRSSRHHPYGLAITRDGQTVKRRFATIEQLEQKLTRLGIAPQAPQATVRRSPELAPVTVPVVEKPVYAGIDHEAQNLTEKIKRRFADVFPFDDAVQPTSRACPVRFSPGANGGVTVHIRGHQSREVSSMAELETRLAQYGITPHMNPTQALAHQLKRCGASPECVASDGKPAQAPTVSTIWNSNSQTGKYGVWAGGARHPVLADTLIEAIQIARQNTAPIPTTIRL